MAGADQATTAGAFSVNRPLLSRRKLLKAVAALPLAYAAPLCAEPPPAQAITPALIAAATKEGQLTWYTSADSQLAEKVGKAFEQKFRGVRVRVERAGGERIFSRVAQEYASGLHVADAVSTGDAAQFLAWKRQELLAPYVPEDVARYIPPEHRDPDGFYASVRSSLCVIAYNTAMVKREDAPKSFANLLDLKWKGKMHHHDFDLSDGARAELVLSRTIGTAAGSAGPVGYRYSEKGRARRTSGYGRRQRVERAAAQGSRRVDRGRLCRRGDAFDCSAVGDFCRRASSQMRRACSRIIFSAWKGRSSL
jgi:hypothetical protein